MNEDAKKEQMYVTFCHTTLVNHLYWFLATCGCIHSYR